MDVALPLDQQVAPVNPRPAVVEEFQLRIGYRATLLPRVGARAYGMLFALTHAELERLYTGPDLEQYRSELGRRQAACVARRFERIPVDLVITSHMARAAETGRCIAERNGWPMVVDPRFQEILRPAIVRGQGRDAPEVLEVMRFVAEHWTNARVKHSDEENFFDLKTRALQALEHLAERPERTLLVVTHGTFLGMLLCCMMAGEEVSPPWFDRIRQFLVLQNAAISVCAYDQGTWYLVSWNDHAHLA
jgi:broad specificity phosphatase PhoE